MDPSRRQFLSRWLSAVSLAAAGARVPRLWASPSSAVGGGASGKRLLILGGTAYLGPELVAAARRRGYTITLFNRGKTHPELFPELEKLNGDRNADLSALKGRHWDAVIDTSGYFPRQVNSSAGVLKDAVKQYVFISTISVYAESGETIDEASPVVKLADETTEKSSPQSYGGFKALCEQTAERLMPRRVLVIRPGLIVGPGDPSDRFTYWPVRVDRGGEVLAPGTPGDPVQFIDVRDLAEWTLAMVDAGRNGVYNAVGPKGKFGMGDLLAGCQQASGSRATFTWVDAKFLREQGVAPWSDMPAWFPPRNASGLGHYSNRRALAQGLSFRPVTATAKDTLGWWKSLPAERRAKPRNGISAEREAAVLAAWRARPAAGGAARTHQPAKPKP